MKCLVLAGGYDQIALIQELKKRSVNVVLVDYFENPPAKKFADKHYKESTLDFEKVKEIATLEKVDLITTACTDQALLTVVKVSEELQLPCYISYQKALNVTNKSYMKKKMYENKIPTAKHVVLDKFDKDILDNFKFPLVVKPVDCNSSKGVKKVFTIKELENAIIEAIKLSRAKTAIVEEFKDGIEVSVDVYVENGIAKVLSLTESTKIKNSNGFTILQSIYPVNISEETISNIKNIAQKISEVFEINDSPLLIQLITDDKEISVIEFSARMGGGTKYKLIEVLTDVNIMSIYVDRILGEKPQVNCNYNVKYAHLNYCYCSSGIFDKLVNFKELKEKDVIKDYFQYKSSGMEITKAETSSDRAAGYLVVDNSLEELMKKERLAMEELKIISEDGKDIFLRNLI